MANSNIVGRVTTMPGSFKRVWWDGRVDNLIKVAQYRTSTRVTSNTPNWSRVSKVKGALYLNNLEFLLNELKMCEGTLSVFDSTKLVSTNSGVHDGFPGGHEGYAIADSVAVGNQALTNAYSGIKNMKVNLAQMFAERRQTANTVENAARRMIAMYRAIRKGDPTAVERALGVAVTRRAKKAMLARTYDEQGVASAILELQYGWKPLLQDVYNSAEALADNYNTRRTVVRSSASGSTSRSATNTNGQMSRTTNSQTKFTVKYCCYLAPIDAGSQNLTSLGITNPALVAWELVPWSFVFDWFIPVGNWINTWDATVGVTVVAHTRTEITESSLSTTNQGLGVLSGGFRITGSTSGTGKLKRVSMTHGSNLPNVGFPCFKDPFSYTHALNAMALAITTRR